MTKKVSNVNRKISEVTQSQLFSESSVERLIALLEASSRTKANPTVPFYLVEQFSDLPWKKSQDVRTIIFIVHVE